MFGVLFTLLVSICSPQGKIVSCFSYLICTYMPVVYICNRYICCWLVSALLKFTFVTLPRASISKVVALGDYPCLGELYNKYDNYI